MIGIKEKSLWKWICKGGLPGQWRRIEHRGQPDCIVNYKRRTFVVELKQMDEWPPGGIIHLELRPAQVSFFRTWRGEKYVLMRVGKSQLFWFDGLKRHVSRHDACRSPYAPSAVALAE